MVRLMFVVVSLLALSACKERKPLDTNVETEEAASAADQTPQPAPEVIIVEKPVEVPVGEPAVVQQEQKPVPPPPVIYLKAGEKYNEYCSFAKKLDIGENSLKLTTENFALKLDTLASDSVQCIITVDATVNKGKKLVPTVNAQSYFAGLGMLASGHNLTIDYNILTLKGDDIEASLEYQMQAPGPIGSDTEFVRSLQLIRRITPPCQTTDVTKRVLVLQILLTLDRGTAGGQPYITVKDLPKIDYTLESCAS